jgi:hypothetical protein
MSKLRTSLPAIVLAALFGCASPVGAQTVTIQRICAPSHVAVAVLRGNGLAVSEAWLDDDGWPVEIWSDGTQGRALVVIGQDDTGALLRCLIFARSPAGEKS